jgi:hypothetical protein
MEAENNMDKAEIFHLANIHLPMEKNRLLLIFVGINLFFTGLDVALALLYRFFPGLP